MRSGRVARFMITLIRPTFTDSRWKMDKWPTFVQVHCSNDVSSVQKLQGPVKCISRGIAGFYDSMFRFS